MYRSSFRRTYHSIEGCHCNELHLGHNENCDIATLHLNMMIQGPVMTGSTLLQLSCLFHDMPRCSTRTDLHILQK